ncbi:polysaccharide pyruvyl transferase CsaB [Heliobacterium chlorum]|uniref:Polysaccharide pyruvyl transferase CsaB n=1 Tax=Heliobacterium chlorum TaxID=2698 RepID=A0ABR7T129_HELCL|nr:polysaccharide pyruvyl transferase CsaB [Heliobacterium chlorum]
MATIVLSGYFGYDNAGDEALLKAMVLTLRRLRPEVHIVVLSGNPAVTRRLHQVEAVYRYNPVTVLVALSQADLVISGGGSLLQDVTGLLTIPYYLLVVLIAKLLGRKVMFYAQGIGPVRRSFGKYLIKKIANMVQLITLRDSHSKGRLKEWGVNRPPLYVTADPVFALYQGKTEASAKEHKQAVFCVRRWPSFSEMEISILEVAKFLLAEGWKISFLPMHVHEDTEYSIKLVQQLSHPQATVNTTASDFEQAIDVIGDADLLIGVRLHALIFGTMQGVPVVGIAYDPKVRDFLREIELPSFGDGVPLNPHALIGEVKRILANHDAEREKSRRWAEQMRVRSERNAVLALELLQSGEAFSEKNNHGMDRA